MHKGRVKLVLQKTCKSQGSPPQTPRATSVQLGFSLPDECLRGNRQSRDTENQQIFRVLITVPMKWKAEIEIHRPNLSDHKPSHQLPSYRTTIMSLSLSTEDIKLGDDESEDGTKEYSSTTQTVTAGDDYGSFESKTVTTISSVSKDGHRCSAKKENLTYMSLLKSNLNLRKS